MVDEWAAVQRHKDELDRITSIRTKELKKHQQDDYKKILEQQLEDKVKEKTEEAKKRNVYGIIEFHASEAEEQLRKKILLNQITKENMQKREFIDMMYSGQQLGSLRYAEKTKDGKSIIRNELRKSYEMEQEMKERKKLKDKEMDLIYFSNQVEKDLEADKKRQKYFENLRERQKMIDRRQITSLDHAQTLESPNYENVIF